MPRPDDDEHRGGGAAQVRSPGAARGSSPGVARGAAQISSPGMAATGSPEPPPVRPRDRLGRPLPFSSPDGVEAVSEQALPPVETLTEAQRLLDEGRAFSAHEVLEARWKAAPPGERELWQGLAQLCVGVTHLQRGNMVGAARLLRRSAGRLTASTPSYDVARDELVAWACALADQLEGARVEADGSPVEPVEPPQLVDASRRRGPG